MKLKSITFYLLISVNMSFAQNFHPVTIDNAANGARCVRMIDLDGDNDSDIIAANYLSNEIDWYENNGSGQFTKKQVVANYDGASCVYAADMDHDNDIDIVGCAYLDDKITWWENDGTQNFTRHDIDSTFDGAYAVIPVDIDKDGDMDIIGSAESEGQVVIWYNDGSENFSRLNIAIGLDSVNGIFPIDLDKDNDVDILATVKSSNKTLWLKNTGGVFSTVGIDSSIVGAQSVYAKDLDNDTDIDIAVVGNGEVSWFSNNGSQVFTKHILDQNFTGGMDISIDDFDKDGDEDILGAASDGELTIWENDGSADFYEWTLSSSVNGARFARIGDINLDGNEDIITAAYSGNSIQWWRQETLLQKINNTNWSTQTIYPGVIWKAYIFDTLYNSNQSLNIIDVNLNTAPVDVVFDGVSSGFKKTSEFGTEDKAITGINGNFFNTSTGGSVNYITRNYTLINNGTNFFNAPRNKAALTVTDDETVAIKTAPAGGDWTTATQDKFMISCGPRLLNNFNFEPNSTAFSSADANFNVPRNPRTFVGTTANNHLLLFTVDGRATQAAGMSMLELSKLAKVFNCKDAFNLDGGGSTTMWVSGQPANGVVNYPSDNHVFDHFGERSCANAILILPNITKLLNLQLCDGDSTLFKGLYLGQTGMYVDTLNTNNKFGQDSILTLDLTVYPPVSTPSIVVNGNTLASSVSAATYNWYANGSLLPQHDSAITPGFSGTYKLIVVDLNGCVSDSSAAHIFTLSGVNENKPDAIHISPNPVSEKLYISGLSAWIGENINLFSSKGEQVFSTTIKSDVLTINCSNLVNGIYLLQIEGSTQKLIVKH